MEIAKWILTVTLTSVMYGSISPLVYARRLQFLSAGSSHMALLAVLIALFLPLPFYITSTLIVLLLIYAVGYAISRGVDPDTATSIAISLTASLSVLTMYYILTIYEIKSDIWAFILGDPLLTTWSDILFLSLISLIVILTSYLTYREQFHIGFDRDCAALSINVRIYDILFYTILAVSTISMLKIVGFVLQHVLILLPCAIAMGFVRGARSLMIFSTSISIFSSILGLLISIAFDLSPSGMIGLVMFSFLIIRWLK